MEYIWYGNNDDDDDGIKINHDEFNNSLYYSINGRRLVLHEVEDGDLRLYKYTPRGINVNREIECFENEIKIKLK